MGSRMIGYLILVHRFPEQFKRLFQAIYDPSNSYVVHVDKNSGPELNAEVKAFLRPYSNADLLESKPAIWGGYSLVDAELRGMKRLLAMSPAWSHFINLSGQDFPLKTQAQIMAYLKANENREFLKVEEQAKARPDTIHRLREFVVETDNTLVREMAARDFLKSATPYIGNQWMIVSRKFCEFVSDDPSVTRFKEFYRNTLIPDEGFFQTVMMNHPHGEIVSDDLRMIDWIPDGDIKLRPRTYLESDYEALVASSSLFARKFDLSDDDAIIDLLERRLSAMASTETRANAA
jgi:Core-2/I-Branching enzyme